MTRDWILGLQEFVNLDVPTQALARRTSFPCNHDHSKVRRFALQTLGRSFPDQRKDIGRQPFREE